MIEFLEPTDECSFFKERGKFYWLQNEDAIFVVEKNIRPIDTHVLPQPAMDNRERLTFSVSFYHFKIGRKGFFLLRISLGLE